MKKKDNIEISTVDNLKGVSAEKCADKGNDYEKD